MGYSGLVASEHSSGNRLRRGSITRTGNSHLRRGGSRSRLGLSATPLDRWLSAEATAGSESQRGSPRDRMEGPAPFAQALQQTHGTGQEQKSNCHRGGTGTAGLYLGYCGPRRTSSTAIPGGLTAARRKNLPGKKDDIDNEAEQMGADGHTKRRILLCSMRYRLRAQSAPLVGRSFRRIMTLRFRPAHIRVINRRYISPAATCSAFQKQPGWLFLFRGRASPEETTINKPSDLRNYPELDKSLHIRTPA